MIKVTNNKRGGIAFKSINGIYITKENEWLYNKVDNCDFIGFKAYLNVHNRRIKTLIAVIKFLFSKKQ